MFQRNTIYLILADISTLVSHKLQFLLGGSRVLWRHKIRTQLRGDIGGNPWFTTSDIGREGFILPPETNQNDCGFLILFEKVKGNIYEDICQP